MPATSLEERIAAVRRFSRFYTRQIGALNDGLLDTPFTLSEARILWELAHRDRPTASDLARDLGVDPGYLSRLLGGLRRRGVVASRRSAHDARHALLSLTRTGKAAFTKLDTRSRRQVAAVLAPMPEETQRQLTAAMAAIERALGNPVDVPLRPGVVLRPPQPGDLGWVVQRHGAVYAREYGYDATFEALVAEIVSRFVAHLDPQGERCWIAECDGTNVGSVFLVRKSPKVAKLRLLLVEPSARGLGVGARLVDECLRFARGAGYRRTVLWTQSELHAARRLYERAGFRLVDSEPHHSFGKDLVAETWEKSLTD